MKKMNCWEFKQCGRIPGGSKVDKLGICPSYTTEKTDKINEGKNGGRVCWVIAGTFCDDYIQGVYAAKLANCINCDFYKLVQQEQGKQWQGAKQILSLL